MSESSTWSDEHGPWPPVERSWLRSQVKRQFVRLAAVGRSAAEPADGVAILAYHATDPAPGQPRWLDFAGQMALLDDLGFSVVSLAEAVERVRSGQPGERPAVALTFDDGWASNLRVAFPELARRGWPATVFITSSFVGRRPFLDAAEVRRLADYGVAAELHTHTHPDLRDVDDAVIGRELAECRARIEDWAGRTPRFFCYPFGFVDRRVRDAVERAGVDASCTAIPGRNRPGQDPQLLKRLTPDFGDGPKDLAAALAGGAVRMGQLRRLLGVRSPSINPSV